MRAKHGPLHKDWHQLVLEDLLSSPVVETRLGPAFTSVGHLLKFDLTDSFPVTLAKKLMFDQVKRELFCFLNTLSKKTDLHRHGVFIWDADMERAGLEDLGPIYGMQWRKWGMNDDYAGYDQLRSIIDELKVNRSSRRALVTAWHPVQAIAPYSALPPCHVMFQFNIVNGVLYTDVYARSADAFLGLPFDVASFAILSRLVANELRLFNEKLNYHIGNLHAYLAHMDPILQELSNEPKHEKPSLRTGSATIDSYHYDTTFLMGYTENRFIKAKLLTDETNKRI